MSGASTYKLAYFDIRGLAELDRLVFVAAGQKFEDFRYPFIKKDDGSFDRGNWPAEKATTPYGTMPVLTVDGKQIAQSAAIARFLARRFGLFGSDDIETAIIDAGCEHVRDIRQAYYTARSDEAKKAEFWNKTFVDYMAALEKNVQGKWFVGNKLSLADLTIYYALWSLSTENKDVVEAQLKANPKTAAVFAAVEAEPKINAYVKARKQTIF